MGYRTVCHEKPVIAQLVKKFLFFYEIQCKLSFSQNPDIWLYPESVKPTPEPHILLFTINFNTFLPFCCQQTEHGGKWLAFLICIQKLSCSSIGLEISSRNFFAVFRSPFRQLPRRRLKIGHINLTNNMKLREVHRNC